MTKEITELQIGNSLIISPKPFTKKERKTIISVICGLGVLLSSQAGLFGAFGFGFGVYLAMSWREKREKKKEKKKLT